VSEREKARPNKEGPALSGSKRWLQTAVNRCPDRMDGAIADAIGLTSSKTIEWVSPLESDAFREYRDQEFLDRLGVTLTSRDLGEFWPRLGPQWDGLARTSDGRCVLVEAKANIREFNSKPSSAGPGSLRRIQEAFTKTQAFLRVRPRTDWSRCFYQYANRIAHLYFLREVNKVMPHDRSCEISLLSIGYAAFCLRVPGLVFHEPPAVKVNSIRENVGIVYLAQGFPPGTFRPLDYLYPSTAAVPRPPFGLFVFPPFTVPT
jgi:hypothetical protein